mmetsp:Transcript_21639/g.54017  ORF Transcript_21639/g.54017 Transcript_21639/m.54017 type:complete len:220 (+) Transcript_21639:1126-1785(+)
MRAVFHDLQLELLGDLIHGLHVGQLTPHVRKHKVLRLRRDLGAQIVRINHVGIGALHVFGSSTCMVDRRGNRGEGEGIGEHGLARLDAETLESDEERGAARVEANAVLEACVVAHGGLCLRRLGNDARLVAEERSTTHQFKRLLPASLWYRIWRGEWLSEHRPVNRRCGRPRRSRLGRACRRLHEHGSTCAEEGQSKKRHRREGREKVKSRATRWREWI